MPPRYAYWTIIAGGLPTAFRATERAELEPTFQRLREKHPDAEMKWFARGKLWDSPEAARPARPEYGDRSRPAGPRREGAPREGAPREGRGRDWRPGGEHRDPRQPYKDAKKARNQRWREEKFDKRQRSGEGERRGQERSGPPRERPHGDKVLGAPKRPWVPRGEAPAAPKRPWAPREGGPDARKKPWVPREGGPAGGGRKPFRDEEQRADRPRPHGDKLARPPKRDDAWRQDRPATKRPWTPREGGPATPKRPWTPREGGAAAPKRTPFDARNRKPFDARERKPFARDDKQGRSPQRDTWRPDRPAAPKRPWAPREGGDAPPKRQGGKPFEARDRKPLDPRDRKAVGGAPKPDWRARPPREKPHGDKLARGQGAARTGDRAFTSKRREDWNNEWKPSSPKREGGPREGGPAPPLEKPHGDKLPDRGRTGGARPFSGRGRFERHQGTEEPGPPPRPRGPNREPRPGENPEPGPPPRPSEPSVPPPGPPERGRLNKNPRRGR